MTDFKEFKRIQNEMQKKVVIDRFKKSINIIAACDSSIINKVDLLSVFVVFKYPELEVLEVVYNRSPITIPYVPGFLSFREAPNLIKAYEKVTIKPDIIAVDGNGIIHPRHLGIASFLGVSLNMPTFGIAKNLLFGAFKQPGLLKGSYTTVIDIEGAEIGYCVRSKDNVKPVFVSPGHLMDAEQSLDLTLKTLGNYRVPELTRIADKYSKDLKTKV